MKFPLHLLLFAASFASVRAAGPVEPPRDPAYSLVWADEFEKDGPPDPAKWRSERGFERNRELQWYQAENSRCEGGFLVIEAREERVPNPAYEAGSGDWRKQRREARYTSGSLITTRGNEWHFGRLEVRARFQARPGLWPAIWTTGLGRWPHAGEIDIMEFYRGDILANFVWAGEGGKDHWVTTKHPIERFGADWNERFHLWVTEWDRETITIYLDGKQLVSLPLDSVANRHGPPVNPFLSPQNIRLNLAVGGQGGNPAGTEFPQRYEIDYVRVYRK